MSALHPFLFEGLPVRGLLVRLDDAWLEVQRRRAQAHGPTSPSLTRLLGELSAAGVLMQANLRFAGAVVLQISGNGPVKLGVCEVQPDFAFRTTATVIGALDADAGLQAMVNADGAARCAITLDPHDRRTGQQPYQGVVPLVDAEGRPLSTLADVLEHYMRQSVQLETRLVLAANEQVAAGLLLQRLPVEGAGNLEGRASARAGSGSGSGSGSASGSALGEAALAAAHEGFDRLAMLAATLTADELLTLDADTLLRRLFWQEPLRRDEPRAPRFACRCSVDRVRGMLRSLGRDESESLIAERGLVEVACEFCGAQYRFDAVDVGEMFTPGLNQPPGSSQLN